MALLAERPISYSSESPHPEVSKEPDLLDGWWTSDYIFQLERRAIFSKTWICVAHRSRFNKPGDYITFDIAGFPVIIMLGKDKIPRAFHNVCRHRAYTITKKPAGSSLVLGCRYHGWSYDTKGNLVKAPQFDSIEGFDKTQNGLFGIYTCTDRAGFVHVNLDSGKVVHPPDLENLVHVSTDTGIVEYGKWLTAWEMSGAFNWKTIGASDRTGIGTPSPIIANGFLLEYMLPIFRRPAFDPTKCEISLIAPATLLFAFSTSPLWATFSGHPKSPSHTTIRCDVYSKDSTTLSAADEQALKDYFAIQIASLEDHYAGTKFIRFEGVPDQLSVLKEHLQHERHAGREIWPGKREGGNSESFCKAEKLCNDLEARAKVGRQVRYARADSVQDGIDW